MDKIKYWIHLVAVVLCILVDKFLGGWDASIEVLVTFTILDFATGIIKAVRCKDLSSRVMFIGALKKISVFIVVAIAVFLDRVFTSAMTFRMMCVGYYIATEGLSILENLALMGVPLPVVLTSVLGQMQERISGNDINKNK